MKIVLNILNFYVKKAGQTMILKMNTTLPCLQFQITKQQKIYEPLKIS